MIPIRIDAHIMDGGNIFFTEIDTLKEWAKRYAGKDITVVFGTRKRDKTLPQLGYLFGHVIPQIAEYTGYSEDEVYGILKYKFLQAHVCLNSNSDKSVWCENYVRSLADCTREEVAKFIDDCVSWGTSLGCEIYPPDKYGGGT